MTERTAAVLAAMGFLLTMFGVGGIESSITDTELLSSLAVSCVGMGLMWCATLAIRVASSYE
jgi:hypothetical protein